MSKKLIEITTCDNCPHQRWDHHESVGELATCDHPGGTMLALSLDDRARCIIPDWCPLSAPDEPKALTAAAAEVHDAAVRATGYRDGYAQALREVRWALGSAHEDAADEIVAKMQAEHAPTNAGEENIRRDSEAKLDEWLGARDAATKLDALRAAIWEMQLTATQAMKLPLAERRLLMQKSADALADVGEED